MTDIKIEYLSGNGSFDSDECIELLKECDVVVTNPPFSLFRDYIKTIMKYEKKFLIIGNKNAITYKEFFPLIKESKVWLGVTLFTGIMPYFKVNDDYPLVNNRFIRKEDGLYKQVNGVCWFTNMTNNRKFILKAVNTYNEEYYPEYDNYDGIECGKMRDFPKDTDRVIGIPITGLKYLHNDGKIHIDIDGKDTQFEIIGCSGHDDMNMDGGFWLGGKADATINGKRIYRRILIKKIV